MFEEIDTTNFNISTNFKENEEWDSMCALSLIAVLDDKYNTQISGNQISEMKTINDLINYIKMPSTLVVGATSDLTTHYLNDKHDLKILF